MARALILVDLQNDFTPSRGEKPAGALAVPGGDEVVPIVNELLRSNRYDVVVATQDWHPADHQSFASQHPGHQVGQVVDLHGLEQVLWPDHCVQGTFGAALVEDLETERVDRVFQKGTDREIDSYSGFFDNGHRKETGLHAYLQERGVDVVDVVGLATDYCVRATALDARELGYETHVIREATRGVDLHAGDVDRAIDQMRDAGVRFD